MISSVGVPSSHLKCSFDNYDWSGKDGLRPYIESFCTGDRNGLILIGKPGVGKTHLMVAAYRYLQDLGIMPGSEVIFFEWQSLLNYLRDGFECKIRADHAMTRLTACRYLIVDDIKPDAAGTSQFWHQILELIIEHCYANKTHVLFSTNADNKDELVERWQISDYHESRLAALANVVTVKGKDRRMGV